MVIESPRTNNFEIYWWGILEKKHNLCKNEWIWMGSWPTKTLDTIVYNNSWSNNTLFLFCWYGYFMFLKLLISSWWFLFPNDLGTDGEIACKNWEPNGIWKSRSQLKKKTTELRTGLPFSIDILLTVALNHLEVDWICCCL